MRSKLFVNPDGTAKMQEIRIEARGKGGAIGIKAVSRLANMVNSLKACKTPQEVYDRYIQITGYCKCCLGSVCSRFPRLAYLPGSICNIKR